MYEFRLVSYDYQCTKHLMNERVFSIIHDKRNVYLTSLCGVNIGRSTCLTFAYVTSQKFLICAVSRDPYESPQDMGLGDSDDIECHSIVIGAGDWLSGCIAVTAKSALFTTKPSTNANST